MGKTILKVCLIVFIITAVVFLVLFVKSHLISSVVVYLALDGVLRTIVRTKRFLLLGIGVILSFFIIRKTWKFLRS